MKMTALPSALYTACFVIALSAMARAQNAQSAVSERELQAKIEYCKTCHGLSGQGYPDASACRTTIRVPGGSVAKLATQRERLAIRAIGEGPRCVTLVSHGSSDTLTYSSDTDLFVNCASLNALALSCASIAAPMGRERRSRAGRRPVSRATISFSAGSILR
jgi:hypothetical protein